jgi:hypothetical protein
MQLKNHRRKCRTLSRALGESRSDVALLKDALIQIVNQSDVHGHWDHEHVLADKALMTLEENIR